MVIIKKDDNLLALIKELKKYDKDKVLLVNCTNSKADIEYDKCDFISPLDAIVQLKSPINTELISKYEAIAIYANTAEILEGIFYELEKSINKKIYLTVENYRV